MPESAAVSSSALVREVIAAAKPDGDGAPAKLAVLPELADRVAGAFQGGEWPGPQAGIGIAAVKGDVNLRGIAGQG